MAQIASTRPTISGAPVERAQRAAQIHEPAALGVDGAAEVRDRAAHRAVLRQPLGVQLGIAAAEIERVDRRQLRVVNRREENQLRAARLQPRQIVGVIEVKRLVARDPDAAICRTLRRLILGERERGRAARDLEERVDRGLDQTRQLCDGRLRERRVMQPQVPLGDRQLVVPAEPADHRHVAAARLY
jgi:hypothetical protein